MSLNSLSGTSGYYYPGMFDSGSHARNKHVGRFSDDDAGAGNSSPANGLGQNSGSSATSGSNATNLTQNAPQATGAAQSVGQSGDQAGQGSNATQGASSSSTLSPDFQSEENVLTTLMDKSLEAMGLVSSSGISGTQISFSGLSYDVSSSISADAGVQGNQASAALDESQSATLEGEGQIVTPDGTTYDFTVALQVGDEQQASESSPLQGGANGLAGLLPGLGGSDASNGSATQAGTSADGSGGVAASSGSSLGNYLAQLVSEMTQAASQAYGSDPNSFLQAPGTATSASSGAAQNTSSASSSGATSSGATSTLPTINWDAIQKQTSSLIDMLDAVIGANQSASANANSNANTSAAGTAAGSATSATSTTPTTSSTSNNANATIAA